MDTIGRHTTPRTLLDIGKMIFPIVSKLSELCKEDIYPQCIFRYVYNTYNMQINTNRLFYMYITTVSYFLFLDRVGDGGGTPD
jgi:hypothetical protein